MAHRCHFGRRGHGTKWRGATTGRRVPRIGVGRDDGPGNDEDQTLREPFETFHRVKTFRFFLVSFSVGDQCSKNGDVPLGFAGSDGFKICAASDS